MNVQDKDMVTISLNGLGFSPSWKPFFQGVFAHANLPNFVKLSYKTV
jgi:hypothetical protein